SEYSDSKASKRAGGWPVIGELGTPLQSKLKVLIVDDHDMVRLGLKTYMMTESEIEVVGEAGNGAEALTFLQDHHHEMPHVILLDLMMPVMDGIEATKQITARYPEIGII